MRPHCIYINTAERTDRDAHMRAQLAKVGWTFERLQPLKFKHSAGFQNRELRSCWHAHESALRRALQFDKCLILEDDVEILNPAQVEAYIDLLPRMQWDSILFYGASRLERIVSQYKTHAYIVRCGFIPIMLKILQKHRQEFQRHNARDGTTSYDTHCRWMQRRFRFWGTEELIVQNRERFGSDTGWGWQGNHIVN